MKRTLCFICVLTILLSLFSTPANAAVSSSRVDITKEDVEILRDRLTARGFSDEELVAEVLYDANEQPTYIIGISKDGYIILSRSTYDFHECGSGNPFEEHMDDRKYYGGPLHCFVKGSDVVGATSSQKNEFYHVNTGEYHSAVPTLVRNAEQDNILQANNNVLTKAAGSTVGSEVALDNASEYLLKKAFGYNQYGTCTAVATQLALNYIAKKNNMAVVPSEYISETMGNSNPEDTDEVYLTYRRAYDMHDYLVYDCEMATATHGYGATLRTNIYYGTTIVATLGFNDMYDYDFNMSYTEEPLAQKIRGNLAVSRPVLVTTNIVNAKYPRHTMCVYGLRETTEGYELRVHTGWYNHNVKLSDGNYSQINNIWISLDDVWIAYYFAYSNPLSQLKDIPDYTNWAYKGILYCVRDGIMSGSNGYFYPTLSMSRAMFVTTLYRLSGSPSVSYPNPYPDVSSGDYYYNAVRWATANGIITGTNQGVFNPDGNITREQIAVILYRYAQYQGRNTSASADLTDYPDYSNVASYARPAMAWAVAEGLLNGVVKNGVQSLAPKDNTTREQVATIIMRYNEQ